MLVDKASSKIGLSAAGIESISETSFLRLLDFFALESACIGSDSNSGVDTETDSNMLALRVWDLLAIGFDSKGVDSVSGGCSTEFLCGVLHLATSKTPFSRTDGVDKLAERFLCDLLSGIFGNCTGVEHSQECSLTLFLYDCFTLTSSKEATWLLEHGSNIVAS